jgi:hypothetical protein
MAISRCSTNVMPSKGKRSVGTSMMSRGRDRANNSFTIGFMVGSFFGRLSTRCEYKKQNTEKLPDN